MLSGDPFDMTIRCLIVDDSPQFLAAARPLLERGGIEVIGVASDPAQAVRQVERLRPRVVLVDIDLGGHSGFEVADRLARLDTASVILISAHAQADFQDLIEASPAIGFIPKAQLSARAIEDLLAHPAA